MVSAQWVVLFFVAAAAVAGLLLILGAVVRPTMRRCRACGHENERAARYCARCGGALHGAGSADRRDA